MIKLASILLEIVQAKKIVYTKPNFEHEWETEARRYPEFQGLEKDDWIKLAKDGHIVKYSQIKDTLTNVDPNFDSLEEPKKRRFNIAYGFGKIELPIAVKFADNDYDLLGGNTRLAGLVSKGYDPTMWVIDLTKGQQNEESKGLWHNIRAKRARGERPAAKGSKAYKKAVAAAKKINADR